MKYEPLPFASATPYAFERAIDEIGAGIGPLYRLTFCQVLVDRLSVTVKFR
jgi:hypothetical protein